MNYHEAKKLAESHTCADCDSDLVYGPWGENGDWIVRCPENHKHQGLKPMATPTQQYRQGMPMHPAIRDRIERKGMEAQGLHRAIALVINEFPRAELTPGEAGLFLLSCMRIGLDPLYGEAVPAPFRDSRRGTRKVQMIITEPGYLSLAARACPHSWIGPPNVHPITDPNEREDICGKRDAWVWSATGRTALMAPGETTTSYGVFTQDEFTEAQKNKTPAAENPSNQARVRAIKHWVAENFAEAKALMMELTGTYLEKVEGIPEVLDLIDAEYRVNALPGPAGRCPIHNKELVKGQYGLYCPTKVPGPKGKEVWCKGVAQSEQHSPPTGEGVASPPADATTSSDKPPGLMTKERFLEIVHEQLPNWEEKFIAQAILQVPSLDDWKEPFEAALDVVQQKSTAKFK
jgi:hypothetical protein